MMLAANFWTVALIQGMYPPDFCFDYAGFVLTSASMSWEQILCCMYVVYMKQCDEESRVVKALPQAISLVG